jgi:lysophospholipase L1-like esterase
MELLPRRARAARQALRHAEAGRHGARDLPGTSSTWGHGIDETSGLDYPSLLGDALRERMPEVPIEVVNAGVSGASTAAPAHLPARGAAGLRAGHSSSFSLSYNDATFLTRFGRAGLDRDAGPSRARTSAGSTGSSRRTTWTAGWTRPCASRRRCRTSAATAWRPGVRRWAAGRAGDRFERALHDVTDLLQSRGIGVVLVKEAQRGNEPRDWKPELYAAIDRNRREPTARASSIPSPRWRRRAANAVFMDPVHLTPRGNRAQAGAIAPVVQELIAQRRGATTQGGR